MDLFKENLYNTRNVDVTTMIHFFQQFIVSYQQRNNCFSSLLTLYSGNWSLCLFLFQLILQFFFLNSIPSVHRFSDFSVIYKSIYFWFGTVRRLSSHSFLVLQELFVLDNDGGHANKQYERTTAPGIASAEKKSKTYN